MRIIVNQSTALGAKTGIGHYTVQLVDALRALAPADQVDLFPPAWWGSFRRLGSAFRPSSATNGAPRRNGWRDAVLRPVRQIADRALSAYLQVGACLRGYDLYHEPNHIPLECAIPTIATVHDLSVLLHPQWHPADRVAGYAQAFENGLGQCRHVLTVSEFTRQELIRVLGYPAHQVTSVHNGVRPELRPLPAEQVAESVRRLGLPAAYLLFVGTIEPRKNPLMLMQAYCDLPASVRERCPLVLAGSWGWNSAEFRAYYEAEARSHGVVHLGYVGDHDLAALYGGARALVFPSFYEGFGLPPLEMMACGGAVLASTAGAVVEVVGSRAHLIDAHDRSGWRDAMLHIIQDDDWQRELRTGVIEWAARFSWQRCASQTLDAYRAMLAPVVPERRAA